YLNIVLKQQNPNTAEVISKGAGNIHQFVDPAAKAGISYDFNGHHHIEANVLGETRAPLANSFYVQQRVSDRSADAYAFNQGNALLNALQFQEKVLSYDLTYILRYPIVTMRLTGYRTHLLDGIEQNGYYNDEYRTFINCMMTSVDKIYQGLEFGAAVKLNDNFTLSGALAYNEAHYTDNAVGVESAENGMKLNGKDIEVKDRILIKNLKVASGPQLVANMKLNFFHQDMWFAEASISYFDESYLAIAPSRFAQGIMTGKKADGTTPQLVYSKEQRAVLGQQESLVSPNWYERIMVDLSVGKLIYLKDRKSININLSVNNVTNNTGMKTGGYQTGRIPTVTYRNNSFVSDNVVKYPAKYYYAWGVNFFLNVGFKF
ncbi:MAG: TonB-dependent receptor, partial [Bacteroidota bacterium]|nr:TonB-dependent receptor [Bacteroidota bacterium]